MVSMPAVVVLIVCRVISAGPDDQNAKYTGAQNLQWEMVNSKMLCRRHEIPMYDPSVDMGAPETPFNMQTCWRSAMGLGPAWDAAHRNSKWRFWKAACPVPLKDYGPDGIKGTPDDRVVGWSLPDCGSRGLVECLVDSVI